MAAAISLQPTVLIIEDDPVTRKLVNDIFVGNGWRVLQADNGDDALEAVENEEIKLIVLDLHMPVLDGYAFLDCLIEARPAAHAPVVLMTSATLTKSDKTRFKGRVAVMIEKHGSGTSVTKQLEMISRAYATLPPPA